MRWIDIILPEPQTHQKLDSLLEQAVTEGKILEQIQNRDGLDNIHVVDQMAKIGQLLFQGVMSFQPKAFNDDGADVGHPTPGLGDPDHDQLVGFHLVVDSQWPLLPWQWLHNGVGFLLEKHPITCAERGSQLPTGRSSRPWMQRCQRADYLVDEEGGTDLSSTLDQMHPTGASEPEFLFVPGHTDRQIRRMIYREAEAMEMALNHTTLPRPLAKIHIPSDPVTPYQLSSLSLTYQALHFAGPVSQALESSQAGQPDWMDKMIEDLDAPVEDELESTVGLEGEVLGVDPITSLLDDVSDSYEEKQLMGQSSQQGSNALNSGESQQRSASSPTGSGNESSGGKGNWLLADGPVEPENLGRSLGIPPLVYSNSYCALPQLGRRFIAAGASTFIGPIVPLFSRPARVFSGYCYQALGEGWCAGAAVWKAAQNTRSELGKEHPAWLSYGVHGFGSLALHYL